MGLLAGCPMLTIMHPILIHRYALLLCGVELLSLYLALVAPPSCLHCTLGSGKVAILSSKVEAIRGLYLTTTTKNILQATIGVLLVYKENESTSG